MATNLAIDEHLLEQALRAGGHRTKKATVNEALAEYIRRCKPRLLIHGHQHVNIETAVSGTRVIGVYGHRMIEA